MARYQEIADALRVRIMAGEWPVGTQLPGISTLQDQYEGAALNTIRSAQQQLVAEGLLETRQGVGAFVLALEPPVRAPDVLGAVTSARDTLTTVITSLSRHVVTFDLDEDDTYSVLSSALQEYASRQHAEADDDPDHPNASFTTRHAQVAESMLDRIEEAL